MPSSDALLSNLTIGTGVLSPAFNPATISYTASIPHGSTDDFISPTADDPGATIKVDGTTLLGSGIDVGMSPGANTVTILVTAADGVTTKTYTIVITVLPSADADLSAITIDHGTLTPSFVRTTTNYTASVANSITILNMTATKHDSGSSMTLQGSAWAGGSVGIALSVGANTVTIVVTAPDGTTTKTYFVVITRAPSSDASLSGLAISAGTLAPSFSSGTNSYTANVANTTTGITVTPTHNEPNSTIKVNGTTVASGSPSGSISLIVGLNVITVVVTAQDGATINSYTINVTRAGSAVDTLSSLSLSVGTLSPGFSSGTLNYTASVSNAITGITVTPTKTQAGATIKVNGVTVASGVASGLIGLAVGANTITIIVTAEDGTDMGTYTVVVTRSAPVCAVTSFSPTAASPGQKVTITGTGFTGATSVKFGGVNAIVFFIVSDTVIEAYPSVDGNGTVQVISPSGTGSLAGFTLVVVKVKMINSPALGRAVQNTDLIWVWDSIRSILCQTTPDQLPGGTGSDDDTGGGGGGSPGNVGTALGSPFKVRNIDSNYFFDGTDSIITDIRLLGKTDYVVSSTDINAEFDNYEEPTGALTATSTGSTAAPNATYPSEDATTLTGGGSGSQWFIIKSGGAITTIIQRTGGNGYLVGDTFSLPSLPGITFTVTSLGGGVGNLVFDEIAGTVTIKNYRLSDNKHITIYADGVTSVAQQTYLLSVKAKMDVYDKVISPVIATGGIVWPWRKAANLIPTGWQECTDFRGKILIGKDPGDVFDATTNPQGLSQDVGTPLGAKQYSLIPTNIPEITINLGTDSKGGSSGYKVLSTINHNGLFAVTFGNATPVPYNVIPPVKIVLWIEYVG